VLRTLAGHGGAAPGVAVLRTLAGHGGAGGHGGRGHGGAAPGVAVWGGVGDGTAWDAVLWGADLRLGLLDRQVGVGAPDVGDGQGGEVGRGGGFA
jgi:hypothetical protein